MLVPPESIPYLVVKQDNNGTTFVISETELPWHTDIVTRAAEVRARRIGAWLHPTSHDIPDLAKNPAVSANDDPPF